MCGYVYVQRRAIQCTSCILKLSGSAKKVGRGKREKGRGSRRGKDGLVEKERGVEGEEGEWEIGMGEAKNVRWESSKAGNVPHTLPFHHSKKCTPVHSLPPSQRGKLILISTH